MSKFLTEEEFYDRVAENIKRVRTEYGDTQLFLDKSIKSGGNLTCQIETRRGNPSLYTMYKILAFYGVEFEEFLK